MDNLCTSANNKEKIAAVFFDVERTFDHICHDGLLHKLHLLGTPVQLSKIIDSFLEKRFQRKK